MIWLVINRNKENCEPLTIKPVMVESGVNLGPYQIKVL